MGGASLPKMHLSCKAQTNAWAKLDASWCIIPKNASLQQKRQQMHELNQMHPFLQTSLYPFSKPAPFGSLQISFAKGSPLPPFGLQSVCHPSRPLQGHLTHETIRRIVWGCLMKVCGSKAPPALPAPNAPGSILAVATAKPWQDWKSLF